jgi:hypothetical protein
MNEALRPLTLGEILDRTFQLYRRNFVLFAGIAALPMLVLLVCGVAAGIAIVPLGIAARNGSLQSNAIVNLQSSATIIGLLAVLVPVVIAVCIAAMVFSLAGITRAALGVCQGRKMKIREALASVRPRFWRYCGLLILQALFAGGIPAAAVSAILMVTAVLARSGAIGPVLSGVIFFLAFCAAVVVAVILGMEIAMGMAVSVAEDRPAVASLKRAIQLSKGTRGRIFVMFLVVWALAMALLMIAYLPMIVVFAIIGVSGAGNSSGIAAVLVGECLYLVIDFAIQTVLPPIYLVALVLFYYDQRIRKEGFDIELLMQQAGLNATAAPIGSGTAVAPSLPLADPATVKEP